MPQSRTVTHRASGTVCLIGTWKAGPLVSAAVTRRRDSATGSSTALGVTVTGDSVSDSRRLAAHWPRPPHLPVQRRL